jgi:hypothetical protein
VREYHVDGFRFDLIGVFRYLNVGDWAKYLNAKYPDRRLLIYGEPYASGRADENGAFSGNLVDRDQLRRVPSHSSMLLTWASSTLPIETRSAAAT